jgi:shikimate kinase
MGSGKTTIGRMLSRSTKRPFVDLDHTIENQQGKTISTLFEEAGEAAFRELERQTLLDCEHNNPSIISTGGGVPCYFDNMDVMKHSGITIYLKTSPTELAKRLKQVAATRPLLKDIEYAQLPSHIEVMLSKREPFYLKADHVIETDGLSDTSVMQRCMDIIGLV